jgi:hypothetical protein
MTNTPYTPGPAYDPNRPPQPAGSYAPQPGPAAPQGAAPSHGPGQGGPATLSFNYRPHDPYAHLNPGQESGPVLPPPPTFLQRWGFLGKDDRPRQVTVILQTLWINLAVTLLVALIGIPVAAGGSSAFGFVIVVLGLIATAANLVLIWAVAKERLGRLGFEDPRKPVYIGLGVFGLNALIEFFSVWTFVPALAQAAATVLVLILFFTRPARTWLREREGNQPKRPEPEQRPLPGEDYLAAQRATAAPPVGPQQGWPAAPPVPGGHPAPPGGHAPAPQGWPQPPR